MRDFRDAKAMAHALRDALKSRAIDTTHSESLELIAKAFGYDNWNILAAKIEAAEQRGGATPTLSPTGAPDFASNENLPTLALPPDITVDLQPPSPDVPSEYAIFVGKWGGYWGGELASNLYVVSVTPSGSARGVYAWGISDLVKTPGAINFRARIEGEILTWGDVTQGIGFEFKVTPDGKLKGQRFHHGGQQGAVVMSKMGEQV
jgi:Glyoxalase superfamily protein